MSLSCSPSAFLISLIIFMGLIIKKKKPGETKMQYIYIVLFNQSRQKVLFFASSCFIMVGC